MLKNLQTPQLPKCRKETEINFMNFKLKKCQNINSEVNVPIRIVLLESVCFIYSNDDRVERKSSVQLMFPSPSMNGKCRKTIAFPSSALAVLSLIRWPFIHPCLSVSQGYCHRPCDCWNHLDSASGWHWAESGEHEYKKSHCIPPSCPLLPAAPEYSCASSVA